MSAPEKGRIVSIKPLLCAFHRDPKTNYPFESCEPGHCKIMTNDAENRALLEALQEISEDLVTTILEGGSEGSTILGSQLASALTIRALVVQINSYLISPQWVPNSVRDGGEKSWVEK